MTFLVYSSLSYAGYQLNRERDRELINFSASDQVIAREHELDRQNFYDPNADYSTFQARVTDRDKSASILKVFSQDKNVKFLRAGDSLNFQVQRVRSRGDCRAYVRDSEPEYLIIYVTDLTPCWPNADREYFRRGMLLNIHSESLAKRVREASRHRHTLLRRREDFFNQLNSINNFLWSYDQHKVILSAEYDEKIERLKRQKQEALSSLTAKKADQISLQRTLMKRLDELDYDLEFYRVETKHEFNRWDKDQQQGLPVQKRPQSMRTMNDF